jgi:hypothetical protein
MRLAKKIARPIYRAFFERPLWWFLAILKEFFLAELSKRSVALEIKSEGQLQKLDNIEERLRSAEASNSAQWDAIEQLLLAILSQREVRISESDPEGSASQDIAISDGLK